MDMVYHKTHLPKRYFEFRGCYGNDCIEDKKVFQRIKQIEAGYAPLVNVHHPDSTELTPHDIHF